VSRGLLLAHHFFTVLTDGLTYVPKCLRGGFAEWLPAVWAGLGVFFATNDTGHISFSFSKRVFKKEDFCPEFSSDSSPACVSSVGVQSVDSNGTSDQVAIVCKDDRFQP
jgi:hypothetical protein